MSVQTEIERIKTNIADAYTAVEEKGGSIPEAANSANLPAAIASIPAGGTPGAPPDPAAVYRSTRPADWLPMPEPQDNEMYLLFHIPNGASSLLAFTVTCTGNYTVALGTVTGGQFVQQSAVSKASGAKYEAELSADDWGDLTSDGMKQVMVKVSGTNLLTWEPSAHSKKTSPANYFGWNIVEISCRLPSGTKVACGNSSSGKSLRKLRYFTWEGTNNLTNMTNMFNGCYSLTAILQLDTSRVTNTSSAFASCYALAAIPEIDTSQATSMSGMFNTCQSLVAIPQIDTSKATNMTNLFSGCKCLATIPPIDTSKVTGMNYMFNSCSALAAIPQLDTSKAATMNGAFTGCYTLARIPQLDTSSLTSASSMFSNCANLESLRLKPSAANWAGCDLSLSGCSLGHRALVDLFNSLPAITSAKALTLTGNPGVSELTAAEKAIATGKNWTLTL